MDNQHFSFFFGFSLQLGTWEVMGTLFLVFERMIWHIGHLHLSKAGTLFIRVIIEITFIMLGSIIVCARR
jgi:hypothetical protein